MQHSPPTLRVITLNIFGQQGRWPDRRQMLTDGLAKLNPGLVAFQETIVNDEYDQVVDLLGPEYHVAHQAQGLFGDSNHAVSIASRWPITATHEVDQQFSDRTAVYPCSTLIAEIDAPEPFRPLLFVDHGPIYHWTAERERELQAVAAAKRIEEVIDQRHMHVVLAGDFNATPDASSMRFWTGLQSLDGVSVCYQEVWETLHPDDPGHTFSPDNPLAFNDEPHLQRGRRIDDILVRCEEHGPTLRVSSSHRIFDQPVNGVWASDHFGMMADFEQWPWLNADDR